MKKQYSSANPEPFWDIGKKPTVERSARQYIRVVGSLTIVFWAKDTIYVTDGSQKIVINRWFDTRRAYREWKNMCDSLKRRNELTMQDVRRLTIKHGFQMSGFTKLPEGVDKLTRLR